MFPKNNTYMYHNINYIQDIHVCYMIAKWNHHDRGKNALKPATGHKICG